MAGRLPTRGDAVAAVTVALVLVPQSLAYAELAGVPAVNGLYTAAVAALAAGLIGSSPYLQTGPTALTSLLVYGALVGRAEVGTMEFARHAALLAVVVGVTRLLLGLLRWGVVAYLMSQPVLSAFTVAASLLIVCSQVPALVGVSVTDPNPLTAAGQAVGRVADWDPMALLLGIGMLALVLGARRISPRIPAALLGSVAALVLTGVGAVDVAEVGDVPSGLPPFALGLPWSETVALIVPGVVIALVGFAEPASIARKYAAQDRTLWEPDREFIGQGLANVAAGVFSGHASGGSFSRSALNRVAGAQTRWSGVLAGALVLLVMPFASVLSGLPRAVLAGLVIAAVFSLLEVRSFRTAWRASRPQFLIAGSTFAVTLASAPRVERGVLIGVALALAVHLWRELQLEVDVRTDGDALHVRPQGVLYFGSAPALEERVMAVLAKHPDVRTVVVHLDQVGRLDYTGALVLRSLVDDMRAADADVRITGTQPQARRLVHSVLESPGPREG